MLEGENNRIKSSKNGLLKYYISMGRGRGGSGLKAGINRIFNRDEKQQIACDDEFDSIMTHAYKLKPPFHTIKSLYVFTGIEPKRGASRSAEEYRKRLYNRISGKGSAGEAEKGLASFLGYWDTEQSLDAFDIDESVYDNIFDDKKEALETLEAAGINISEYKALYQLGPAWYVDKRRLADSIGDEIIKQALEGKPMDMQAIRTQAFENTVAKLVKENSKDFPRRKKILSDPENHSAAEISEAIHYWCDRDKMKTDDPEGELIGLAKFDAGRLYGGLPRTSSPEREQAILANILEDQIRDTERFPDAENQSYDFYDDIPEAVKIGRLYGLTGEQLASAYRVIRDYEFETHVE